MFSDLSRNSSHVVDHVQVEAEGMVYRGRGILRWDADTGFSVDGLVTQYSGERHKTLKLGGVRIADPDTTRTVRMRLQTGERVVLFHSGLGMQLGLHMHGHLCFRCTGLTLIGRNNRRSDERASGQMDFSEKLDFTHARFRGRTARTVTVDGETVSESWGMGVNLHSDDGHQIVVYPTSDESYRIVWTKPALGVDGLTPRSWEAGLRFAWQLVTGALIEPLRAVVRDRRRCVTVIRRHGDVERLKVFTLFDDRSPMEKELLLHLSNFFARPGRRQDVAKHLFWQAVDGSRGHTWNTSMFLIASGLEAALRTLYEHPFSERKKDDTFKFDACLRRFQEEYLGPEWKTCRIRAGGTFRRMRNRTAHPDWSRVGGGALTAGRNLQRYDDLAFFFRLYGYMILALSGWNNIRPVFPDRGEGKR